MKNFLSNYKNTLLIFVTAFCLISCKPLLKTEIVEADENIPVEQPKIEVQLTYTIDPTPDHKLQILGETNLPDGTKLNVRVRGKSVIYDSLSEIKVRNGYFRSAEFSSEKRELPTGEYWVTVTMVLSTMQSQPVREIIGKGGENLSGDIVRRYDNSAATIVAGKHFYLNSDGSITLINKPKSNANVNVSIE